MPHPARQFDRRVSRQHDNFAQARSRRKYAASVAIAPEHYTPRDMPIDMPLGIVRI
jgi:hypothetical protein